MRWFNKKRTEVVDFALMQKRGLLPTEPQTSEKELMDFRQAKTLPVAPSNESSFDFLNSMATASSNDIITSQSSIANSLRDARKKAGFNAEVNQLKVQQDNLDYKINTVMDKIVEIERKLREKGI